MFEVVARGPERAQGLYLLFPDGVSAGVVDAAAVDVLLW